MRDIEVTARLENNIRAEADLGVIKEVPVGPDIYAGEYDVAAPSDGELTLPTKDKMMMDDVTIEANHEIEDGLLSGDFPNEVYYNDRITELKNYAFYYVSGLKVINLPYLTDGGVYLFAHMDDVEEIYIPRASRVSHGTFQDNPNLRILDLGLSMSSGKLARCPKLEVLVFRYNSVWLPNAQSLVSTPFAPDGAGGYLYVPQSLLERYQASEAWATYAHVLEFRPIEGSEYELEE